MPRRPDDDSIIRPIGTVLCAWNDDWQSRHRHMQVEAFSLIDSARIDRPPSISSPAA